MLRAACFRNRKQALALRTTTGSWSDSGECRRPDPKARYVRVSMSCTLGSACSGLLQEKSRDNTVIGPSGA